MIITRILKSVIFYLKFKRKMKACFSYFDPFSMTVTGLENIEIFNNAYIAKHGWIASIGGGKIIIDNNASIGRFVHIISTRKIHICQSALIAEKVYISDNLHGFNDINTPIKDQPLRQLKEVTIGSGSWIGENVCIIGASVGKNSVVGANSVVTHDIPDYCVAVGAPAKIIKRFDSEKQKWVIIS